MSKLYESKINELKKDNVNDFNSFNNYESIKSKNHFDVDNIENTNVLGVFEDLSQFISSDICDLEVCELAIFQNFKLVEISMPRFLNEVFLED